LYSDAFKELLNEVCPEYSLPCFETLKTKMNVYLKDSQSELKKLLATLKYYSLTLDLWTSLAKHHYIIYTIHYIDLDNQLKSRLLRCEEVPQVHVDHLVIVNHLTTLFEDYNLDKKKVGASTADAGGNVKKAIEVFGIPYKHCLGHSLNLVVQECLEDIRNYNQN
jgi:hypothetical protein